MPSTRLLNVKIKSLPCLEQEGMIWIWPGSDPPTATLPSLQPPPGFKIHAEVCYQCIQIFLLFEYLKGIIGLLISIIIFWELQIVMELPVEHGLLLDNLLDLAHAPFTHTSTFAKGWSVPRFVPVNIAFHGYFGGPIQLKFCII